VQQKGLDFGAGPQGPKAARRALTVAELTDRIQGALEVEFADVWVEGEVSNLKFADSGHWYFSLKDAEAQIRAVLWKTAARGIRFRPQDGMKVLARGRVSVYALRGEYQLSVDALEPLGRSSRRKGSSTSSASARCRCCRVGSAS
jgi:exodeoxyribonuclease VII large subunit